MFELAKFEFSKWLQDQDTGSFSPFEKTMTQILIDHFDEIATVGIAKAQRVKLIAQKITELNQTVATEIKNYLQYGSSGLSVKKLKSMKVERFRGFLTQVDFDFSNQYSLFYGPNGSGKTSFCEALEYGLLGTIEEASARNIPLEKYIVHAGERKATHPKITGVLIDGSEDNIQKNLSEYRFAFIEKNRIDAFSHMGATTAKTQNERIAALFGLAEFQNYLAGFTETFDERYIALSDTSSDNLKIKEQSLKETDSSIKDEVEKKTRIETSLSETIQELENPSISSVEDAIKDLNDPTTGRIPLLEKNTGKNKIPLVYENAFLQLKNIAKKYLDLARSINESEDIILQNASETDFQQLYQAICKIEKTGSLERCPACHTLLSEVRTNPFEYAKEELGKLKRLEAAQKTLKASKASIIKAYMDFLDELQDSGYSFLFPTGIHMRPHPSHLTEDDFTNHSEGTNIAFAVVSGVFTTLNNDNLSEEILQYNTHAEETNRIYDEQINTLRTIYKTLITHQANLKTVKDRIEELKKQKDEKEIEYKTLEKEAEERQKKIGFNVNMVNAYYAIIGKLKSYAVQLPSLYAKEMADKAVEIYNAINDGDADFELLKDISIPLRENDRIMITTQDGTKQDAMQILSEGHIKILGLSILLAKAVQSSVPFIIFDDVVNAIDDDHRNGVARVLTEHPDFADKQMIITCHGEMFVQLFSSRIIKGHSYTEYVFLPADTLAERGIVIKYHDPSIPLSVARKKYNEGYLRDCASKCRQAVECISGKLWKKLEPFSGGGISVQLKGIKDVPNLRQIIDSFVSMTKPQKFEGTEAIHERLVKLTAKNMWALLNKGTHYDSSTPEFNRGEIKELLELVESLSEDVNNFKGKPKNIGAIK